MALALAAGLCRAEDRRPFAPDPSRERRLSACKTDMLDAIPGVEANGEDQNPPRDQRVRPRSRRQPPGDGCIGHIGRPEAKRALGVTNITIVKVAAAGAIRYVWKSLLPARAAFTGSRLKDVPGRGG